MMFASKIAKLGKAPNMNCYQVSNDPLVFNVFICKDGVSQKTLSYSNDQYSLSKIKNTLNYSEVLGINSDYIVARNDQYFSLLKVDDGS